MLFAPKMDSLGPQLPRTSLKTLLYARYFIEEIKYFFLTTIYYSKM